MKSPAARVLHTTVVCVSWAFFHLLGKSTSEIIPKWHRFKSGDLSLIIYLLVQVRASRPMSAVIGCSWPMDGWTHLKTSGEEQYSIYNELQQSRPPRLYVYGLNKLNQLIRHDGFCITACVQRKNTKPSCCRFHIFYRLRKVFFLLSIRRPSSHRELSSLHCTMSQATWTGVILVC